MYGESVTLTDALVITLFSMGLVFMALVVLSYSIDIIAKIVGRTNKKQTEVEVPVVQEEPQEELKDDQELIAVISACVACMSGKSLNSFFIRDIRRSELQESEWAKAGRMELMK